MKSGCLVLFALALLLLGLCAAAPGLADEQTRAQTDANALFAPHGLNVASTRLREEYVLPDTLQLSKPQEEAFYWACVNALLAADGMTLTDSLGQRITATLYDTDTHATKAVVLTAGSGTIGAYRLRQDGLYALDGRSFEEATGKSMLAWLVENGNPLAGRFEEATRDARKTAELYFEASIARDWMMTAMLITEKHAQRRMPSLDEMRRITQPPAYMLAQSGTVVEIISMEETTKIMQPPDERYFTYFAEFSNDNGDGNLRQMIVILCLTEDGWRVDRFATGL